MPTGTPSIATEAQAQAAAGASGTYSETPTAANIPNIINPNRLRAALQAYDPEVISGERRVYARVVSGVTATSGDYEWLNVTDAVAGNFLPLSGGTVDGYTNFTAGLGISGNVQITGNITQTGNHTTSGTYNASRASSPGQVLYQVNNSAGRGIYQGDHQGVAFAKGGSGVAEFTVTGDQTFGVISGDLRVGGDNQNVSDVNSSQFWALSGGQFVSAFSTNESIVWKDAAQGDILKLQSNVGGQRSDQFIFTASGDLTVTGKINAQTGEFLTIDALEENNGLIRSFSGDFHSLVVGDPAIYGAFLENPALTVIGSGIFHSGVFFTDNTDVNAMAIYGPASNTGGPNIVIGRPGVLEGVATRNSVAIGDRSQENATSDSDRNIAIGNNTLQDMTDGHQNIAIGHAAAQNIRPGNNQGANTVIGDNALFGNTAANNTSRANVVVGRAAMFDALQARNNVAIGTQAGFNLVTVTGNVLIGESVNRNGTTGDDNVFIGNLAALNNTASGNIAIGAESAQSLTDGNNNTIIGSIAGAAGMSDTIILGAGTTQKFTVSGDNFTLTSADGDDAIFVTSGLTADRTYTLPNQSGTIALTSDIAGGGTVTSVATNSGLGGGPITAAGTIGIAASGVDTIQLADDAVTAPKLNASGQAANRVLAINGSNNGMAWVAQAGGGIEQGTVMLFFQAAAPTGFTQVTTQNNKALRVVSGNGGGTGGDTSFTDIFGSSATLDLSGSVGDTTLTTTQIPSHAHSGGGGTAASSHNGDTYTTSTPGNTGSAGSNGSHTHSLTTASVSVDMDLEFIDIILASKD